MTDVFFSYSSKDREQIRFTRDALVRRGFDVFWDQEVPAGREWNSWIMEELGRARSVVVFWSLRSVTSRNVRHEAQIALEQDKLIPVFLDPLGTAQLPMGHQAVQAVPLIGWQGDEADPEWRKLVDAIESRLTRLWMRRQMAERETMLKAQLASAQTLLQAAQADREVLDHRLRSEIDKQKAIPAQAAVRKSPNWVSWILPIAILATVAGTGAGYVIGQMTVASTTPTNVESVFGKLPPNQLYQVGRALIASSEPGDQLWGIDLVRRAANRDVAAAMFDLALLHLEGRGVIASRPEFLKWIDLARANGEARAERWGDFTARVARLVEDQDWLLNLSLPAIGDLVRAATSSNATTLLVLADDYSAKGTPTDHAVAVALYRTAALIDEPGAFRRLTDWLLSDIERRSGWLSIAKWDPQSTNARACLLRKERGLSRRFRELAVRYDRRVDAVDQDFKQASRLVLAAILLGESDLMKELDGDGPPWSKGIRVELQRWLKMYAGNTGLVDGRFWIDGPAATALKGLANQVTAKPCG